ncbi:MAG TPA: hypothetical protein VIM60_05830 [Edaphobacter sp.]
MNMFALLLVFFSFAGQKTPASATVKPPAPTVAGRYVLENAREMGSELVLRPGGEFEYTLAYGAADYSASGKWKAVGETVVLDSKSPDGPPIKLVRSTDLRSPDVRVWVKNKAGQPVANIDVALTAPGGESTTRTDRDGMALFPGVSEPKSVIVRVPVYEKDSGPVSLNSSHTDFTFEINPAALTAVPFKGEVLQVKYDTLELLYWDKTKPMIYRRQESSPARLATKK